MPTFVNLTLHAGHDGSLHLVACEDASAAGGPYNHQINTLTANGWTGWQPVGSGPVHLELRRYPNGRLVLFSWPGSDGDVRVRVETAPGSRAFSAPQTVNVPDATGTSVGQMLVRGLADGRMELFVMSGSRAFRTLQSAPSGSFSGLVDMDGSSTTPVTRLVCVGEMEGGTPMAWGLDSSDNLRGAQPSSSGSWAWTRTVDYNTAVKTAFYEGRRGFHELFYVTETNSLVAHRIIDLFPPQSTVFTVPVRTTGVGLSVSPQHLVGHYAGDGRLYLFTVVGTDASRPAVIAEVSPGSAWQAQGAGWTAIQTPALVGAPPVRRLCAGSYHTDGRLACAALFRDGTVRVSTQASLGSTSWSPWSLV